MYSGTTLAKRRLAPVSDDKPNRLSSGAGTEAGMFADGCLAELLGIDHSAAVASTLRQALLDPVVSLTANPGKRIRAQLVAMTYRLFYDDRAVSLTAAKQCRDCAEVVELMHAGSLIVDDIEDGSEMRRGRPALHVQYGVPLALNAGNWLYFWPFELLKDAGLAAEKWRVYMSDITARCCARISAKRSILAARCRIYRKHRWLKCAWPG